MENNYQPPQADLAYHNPDPNAFVREQEHVKILMIFQYIWAGMMVLGALAMFAYAVFFKMIINNPQFIQQMNKNTGPNGPPPQQLFEMMVIFYYIASFICLVAALLNLMSAYWMQKRRNRMFSVVIGALNCIAIPIGTILGIFTIVVLVKENVRRIYERTM